MLTLLTDTFIWVHDGGIDHTFGLFSDAAWLRPIECTIPQSRGVVTNVQKISLFIHEVSLNDMKLGVCWAFFDTRLLGFVFLRS